MPDPAPSNTPGQPQGNDNSPSVLRDTAPPEQMSANVALVSPSLNLDGVPQITPATEGADESPRASSDVDGARQDEQPLAQPRTGLALLILVTIIALLFFGSDSSAFLDEGWFHLPFAVLATLAYIGMHRKWSRVVVFIWLAALVLTTAVIVGTFVLRAGRIEASHFGVAPPRSAVIRAVLIGIGVSWLLLFRGVRQIIAQWIPIQVGSLVHTVALSYVAGATTMLFGTLIAAGGYPPMLTIVTGDPKAFVQSESKALLSMLYGLVWTIPGALAAVGFPAVRTLRGALARLGVVRPTRSQVWRAFVLAIVLVPAGYVFDVAVERLWTFFGSPVTDGEAFGKLMESVTTPAGAVIIAVSAGVGEELLVRGALQPRLGWLLSNLFFTALHAPQYGGDTLLSVFLVGYVMSVVRVRSNTTTCAIVHGVYDFILVMAAVLWK